MLEKMSEMIAEQLNCDAAGITAETSFKDDLGADSLDLFELVMALEDEYNIEIPAEDLTDLTTVGAVMDYLKNTPVCIWQWISATAKTASIFILS